MYLYSESYYNQDYNESGNGKNHVKKVSLYFTNHLEFVVVSCVGYFRFFFRSSMLIINKKKQPVLLNCRARVAFATSIYASTPI